MPEEERNLFGVVFGALKHYGLRWTMGNEDGLDTVIVDLGWANREATTVYITVPTDQQVCSYIATWNDLTINGSWHGAVMAGLKVRRAVDKCKTMGATIVIRGPLPRTR